MVYLIKYFLPKKTSDPDYFTGKFNQNLKNENTNSTHSPPKNKKINEYSRISQMNI